MTNDEHEEQQRLRDWNYVRNEIAFWKWERKNKKGKGKYAGSIPRERLKELRKELATLMPPKNAANLPPIKFPKSRDDYSDWINERVDELFEEWTKEMKERGVW